MAYWRDTRHPAPSLFFVLPMLVAYEFGVVAIGGPQSLAVRNGADAWVRWLLAHAGLGFGLLAPFLIFMILFIWAVRHQADPPDDAPGLVLGMAFESIGCALALWALSRAFGPMLDSLGIQLSAPSMAVDGSVSHPLAKIVTFMGAGIYEEVIFRIGFFSGTAALLQVALVPGPLAKLLAAFLSAFCFAAVHHLGAHGEAINSYVFVFRTFAGLLFTLLFTIRGFGITVGTHACYDVLVGISV